MSSILFALVVVFAAISVECAPGKKSRRVRKKSTTGAVSSIQTPAPVAIIFLEGLDIAPTAASILTRELHTIKVTSTCAMCEKGLGANPDDLLVCGGCETTYYCSKECQKLHRKSHKVSRFSLITKAKCKNTRESQEKAISILGSNLPLTVNRWTEDYAEEIRFLLLSTFFKVDTNRFENYVAFIMIEENEHGFRVVLAEELPVTSLILT
jgi:hypothetical protein